MTSDEVAVVRGFQMALDWRRNSARPFQAWVALNTRAKVEGIEPSRNQRAGGSSASPDRVGRRPWECHLTRLSGSSGYQPVIRSTLFDPKAAQHHQVEASTIRKLHQEHLSVLPLVSEVPADVDRLSDLGRRKATPVLI